MKKRYWLVTLIFLLSGCSSKAEVAEAYRYWNYGFTAPPYFQIKTDYIVEKLKAKFHYLELKPKYSFQ